MVNAELLAPAGDMEALKMALRYGADAVYIGGPEMQLRAQSAGFSREALPEAAALAHAAGKKLYVAVNIFAGNAEVASAGEYARWLHSSGADAVIISDLGVLRTVKQAVPELPVHISTQANCLNYMTARTYYEMGAECIVLGREMSIEDIAELRAKTPAELRLECFVHGAMCMSYSGRCLISAFLAGRSGNKGQCAQPCRWSYALVEEKRPGEYFPINEEGGATAILSSRDLCCIGFLEELAQAGISSFKIEGRMKSSYYVATAVNAYRMRMDGADAASCMAELECAAHRQFSSGFYYGELRDAPASGGYSQDCIFAGVALGWAGGTLTLEQRGYFSVGDTLEILSPGKAPYSFAVAAIEAQDGTAQQCANHARQIVKLPCAYPAQPLDIIRRRAATPVVNHGRRPEDK